MKLFLSLALILGMAGVARAEQIYVIVGTVNITITEPGGGVTASYETMRISTNVYKADNEDLHYICDFIGHRWGVVNKYKCIYCGCTKKILSIPRRNIGR